MKTIQESNQKTGDMPKVLPEAALFSVIRPNQLNTEAMMSGAIDGLSGRSLSLTIPPTRKASIRVRGWVKRSNTSRAPTATQALSPSESMKRNIKHLGGGRLDKEKVQVTGTANNVTLLAPAPIRSHKSQANSIDSRVTQWLDFYNGPREDSKPPTEPPTQPHQPKPHQSDGEPSSQHPRPESNTDLRPAPLRVPSSERCKGPSTPPKPLARKNSKWKPLPNLPTQNVSPKHSGVDTPPGKRMESESGRSPEPAIFSHGQQDTPKKSEDLGFLPMLRFDSPPPTPDSSAGGAARVHHMDEDKEKPTEGEAPPPVQPNLSEAGVRDRPKPKRSATDPTRHTRQERIWLHVNYRGEAPFLQAWGLDITKLADRMEGLALVRELIQAEAEAERKSVERDPGAGIQGSTMI